MGAVKERRDNGGVGGCWQKQETLTIQGLCSEFGRWSMGGAATGPGARLHGVRNQTPILTDTAGLAPRHQNHFNLSDFFLFILIALAMPFATLRGHEQTQDAAMSTARLHVAWARELHTYCRPIPQIRPLEVLKIG